jgi:ASC-1-like (ASCH) protein
MKVHRLKTINPYFEKVWAGKKLFEVRFNDREFKVNDIVYLEEFDPILNVFSRRVVKVKILYILDNYEALHDNYVVFSFFVLSRINLCSFNHE